MGNELDRANIAFAKLSYRTFQRVLVFQRPPKKGETQNDLRGFPTQGTGSYVDVDSVNPIPCNFTIGQRRDLTINGQTRTVTTFKITIPCIYNKSGVWTGVEFSSEYRAHILYKNDFNLERYFQVVGEGADLGPDLTFESVELKDLM